MKIEDRWTALGCFLAADPFTGHVRVVDPADGEVQINALIRTHDTHTRAVERLRVLRDQLTRATRHALTTYPGSLSEIEALLEETP